MANYAHKTTPTHPPTHWLISDLIRKNCVGGKFQNLIFGSVFETENMVTNFFRNSKFSDFLGIKSEINRLGTFVSTLNLEAQSHDNKLSFSLI